MHTSYILKINTLRREDNDNGAQLNLFILKKVTDEHDEIYFFILVMLLFFYFAC
jgi:hypothetical protein